MSVALPYDPGMPGWDQESRLVKRGFPGCLNHTDRAAELHKCSHRFLLSLSVDCFGLGGMYLLLTRIHLSLTWPNALGLGYHCRVAVAMLMHDINLVLPTISHLNFDNGELVFVFTSPVLVTIIYHDLVLVFSVVQVRSRYTDDSESQTSAWPVVRSKFCSG